MFCRLSSRFVNFAKFVRNFDEFFFPVLRNLCVAVADWPFIPDTELVAKIIKKLPLLECLVMWSGSFQEELLVALLDHCPRLELLDVFECWPNFAVWHEPIASRIRSCTIKDLRLPEMLLQ